MTLEIGIVLATVVLTLYLFITEKFGIDTISIIIMTLLMVTGILTPHEGLPVLLIQQLLPLPACLL